MTVLEKIEYLITTNDVSTRKFLKENKISKSLYKKWKNGEISPKEEDIAFLCDKFGFSISDFMDDNSTISYDKQNSNEHPCAGQPNKDDSENAIDEDYPPEDNARYEEKD